MDQLDRDALRFLELTPDIKMANVKIATNEAFPLAHESSNRALTKEDFEPQNDKKMFYMLVAQLISSTQEIEQNV